MKHFITAIVSVGALFCSHAIASTETLWQGGTGGAYLDNGVSFASSFDANLLFSAGVDDISSASLTLNFVGSNATADLGTSSVVTNTTNFHGFEVTSSDTTHYYSDALDSARVMIGAYGGQTTIVSDLSGAYTTTTLNNSAPSLILVEYSQDEFGNEIQNFYSLGHNRDYTIASGYNGSFSSIVNLDATSLDLLEATGILRYGFKVLGGGLALSSATLTFSTAPVPEPATYGMLMAGLGLIGFIARRKKAV